MNTAAETELLAAMLDHCTDCNPHFITQAIFDSSSRATPAEILAARQLREDHKRRQAARPAPVAPSFQNARPWAVRSSADDWAIRAADAKLAQIAEEDDFGDAFNIVRQIV